MRRWIPRCLALTLSAAVLVPCAGSAEGSPPGATEGKQAVYEPPPGTEAREWVGAVARLAKAPAPALQALVPDHVGRTTSERPLLFWFLSAGTPAGSSLYFTLIDDVQIDPLVEVRLPETSEPGIHRVDLAPHGVRLERDVEYEWSVALVLDPQRRSEDIVTRGWIRRVEPPMDLPEGDAPSAKRLAAHGLWYDALAAAIGDRPLRDALLRDAGLSSLVSGRAERSAPADLAPDDGAP